jgi:hypothetical protein
MSMSDPANYMPPKMQAAADAAAAQAFPGQAPVDAVPPTPATPPIGQPQEPTYAPPVVYPPYAATPEPQGQPQHSDESESLRQELQRTLQQLNTLRGKYKSEDVALQRVAELEQQLSLMQQQAASQSRQQPAQATTGAQASMDARSVFGDQYEQLAENLGPEDLEVLMAGFNRMVSGQLSSQVAPLNERIERSKRDTFVSSVGAAVGPDFDAISNDPAFKAWLEVPAFGNFTRLDQLSEAHKAGDVRQAVAVYSEYKKLRPRNPSASTPVQAADLESQIMPTGSGSGGPPRNPVAPSDNTVYTGKQLALMSNQIANGNVRGEAAEKQQALIERAITEGRVTA